MRQLVSIAGVVPDRWTYLGELADPAIQITHLIVPWADWQKAPADWRERAPNLGVSVPADTAFSALQPSLDRLGLIAIAFPGVSEGRGYSLARQLRERGGFQGELRAAGEIFRDHVLFLARCGFDSFEVSARESPEGAFAALKSFSVAYQPVHTDPPSITLKRRQV
jgi:uncharacterized protein (DUF934 family)